MLRLISGIARVFIMVGHRGSDVFATFYTARDKVAIKMKQKAPPESSES